MSTLDKFSLLMKMNADYLPRNYGLDIFHYTSANCLPLILLKEADKAILWASRYDCLNDASEGQMAEKIYQEVCQELREQGRINEELYNLFSKITPARTIMLDCHRGDSIRVSRKECDRYVCSFSNNPDSLAMWNYYSKGNKYEGFNIGFMTSVFIESLKMLFQDKEARFQLCSVVYDHEEQKKMIKELLIRIQENYSSEYVTSIRYIISNRLTDWGLVFKNQCFKHEEEVRIIIDVAKNEKAIPVKYRTTSGYIVPYIELAFEKHDVSYVRFGPLQCDNTQKQHQMLVLEEMLNNNNYSAQIGHSSIPVRY